MDASCRVLIISPTLLHAKELVERLRALSPPGKNEHQHHDSKDDGERLEGNRHIPFIISNKYYTAPIHFAVYTTSEFSASLARGVPAVIFGWESHHEDYEEHARQISEGLEDEGLEPEVVLAVRTHVRDDNGSDAVEADEEAIDGIVTSHGFEYVCVPHHAASKYGDIRDGELEREHPSLPRVLDALSTIMWPSMSTSAAASSRLVISDEPEEEDWTEAEDPLKGLHMLVGNGRGEEERRRTRREMEELARWLREGETEMAGRGGSPGEVMDDEGIWENANRSETPVETPAQSGFDDDFTVFVSAPPSAYIGNEEEDVGDIEEDESALAPGLAYHSLASVSDFGDPSMSEFQPSSSSKLTMVLDSPAADLDFLGDDKDVKDSALPSQAEIAAATMRIFGPPIKPGSGVHSRQPLPPPSMLPSASISATRPTAGGSSVSPPSATFPETFGEPDDYDPPPFDLSSVLSSLESMKAEIATISDDDERRRAAARAALGLVYGLERR